MKSLPPPVPLLALLACLLCFPLANASSAPAKPNIVFILADDLGITDINAYAARYTGARPADMFFETPNLDRLVSQGTAFSQAYACQLCSPTRASLLTGKNAARLGVTTAVGGTVRTYYNQALEPPPGYLAQDALEWADKEIKIPQALINGTTLDALPAGNPLDQGRNEVTLPEALTQHHSAFLGKWHLGGHGARGWQPKDQGFEELSYFDEGGSPYFNWRARWDLRKLVHPQMPQPELLQGKSGGNLGHQYLTDELTDHAVRFLKQRASPFTADHRPFFLYLCHFAVHTPFQGRSNDVAYFERKATRGWNGHSNAVYAAMVKALDDSVGRILQTLSETSLETNTLVVFMSDNGGVTYTDPLATWNAPFKGGKAMHFEGGIRVPLVFRWKGQVLENQWCNVPVDSSDLFPTILDLAGYDVQPYYTREKIDGRSLVPLFRDPDNKSRGYPRDTFYWHYPLNVIVKNPDDGQPLAPHSTIRQGDWKLIFDWSGLLKLYNIARDPYEKNELSAAMPDRAQALFRQLNDWLDANVAVKYTPALNPDYLPAAEVRPRPFLDLRKSYLGEARAIRSAASDPRLRPPADAKPVMMFGDTSRVGRPFSKDPSVIRFGNRYLMYFSLPPFSKELGTTNSPRGWSIGIAESHDLVTWKKVRELWPQQDCDRNGLCAPGALVLNGKVHLFYQTYGNGPKDAICHAISDDGLEFQRDPSNPVFHPAGDWNSGRAIDAEAFPFGDQLLLYFATRDPSSTTQMLGVASAPLTSDFSRSTFQQISTAPLLKPELPWEKKCIEAPSIIRRGDTLYMFYAGGYNNDPQQIGVANSADGVKWTRLSDRPLLPNGPPGSWNSSESGHPGIFSDHDGRTYLFFQGNPDKGKTWLLSCVEISWTKEKPVLKEAKR